MAFTLPDAYPLAGVGLSAFLFLNVFQIIKVVKARKASGVKYPALYATEAEAAADPAKYKFNCTQRAHQNTLESLPLALAMYAYTSLFHPKYATGAALSWTLGRVFYTINYSSGDPKIRGSGLAMFYHLGNFSLLLGTLYLTITQAVPLLMV